MKKVNFDVKLPAFVERIVYVDNYGARPYCYTIEDASRNADAINRAINYISERAAELLLFLKESGLQHQLRLRVMLS